MALTTTRTAESIPIGNLMHNVLTACGMRPNDTSDQEHALIAVRTVLGLLVGQLRGRVPLPLPVDLGAVLQAACVRYTLMLAATRGVRPVGGPADTTPPVMPQFQGWTFPEAVVIARYRRSTV